MPLLSCMEGQNFFPLKFRNLLLISKLIYTHLIFQHCFFSFFFSSWNNSASWYLQRGYSWRKTAFLIFLLLVLPSLPRILFKRFATSPDHSYNSLCRFPFFWSEVTQIGHSILSEASSVFHIMVLLKHFPFWKYPCQIHHIIALILFKAMSYSNKKEKKIKWADAAQKNGSILRNSRRFKKEGKNVLQT